MKRQIGLYSSREEESAGGLGLLASVLIHVALITTVLVNTPTENPPDEQPLTYVELAPTLPQPSPQGSPSIIEAPGPESSRPSADAPLSDANRRSSTPRPSGNEQTDRPGLTNAPYIPGSPAPGPPQQQQARPPEQHAEENRNSEESPVESDRTGFRFEESSSKNREQLEDSPPAIDWSSAIQQAGKIASLGGAELGNYGGEEGFAESGPISFETQWYEWGDYATGMIRRIRYHWYNNMPALVRMGVTGVVVIRFTIQRDGTITDVEMLQSSTHPPFDFAARKAIELSSPLRPLPADFPKQAERVTVGFYYNLRPPRS